MSGPATEVCRVSVLGVGSVLHGDDGLGPYMVERLRARFCFPEHFSLEDVGTPGPGLVNALEDLHAVIIIDAIKGDPPGQIRRYNRDDILAGWDGQGGSHDPALAEALLLAELQGRSPSHVVLLGLTIEPATPGLDLSPTIRRALPALEEAVLNELRDGGVDPIPLDPLGGKRAWWRDD